MAVEPAAVPSEDLGITFDSEWSLDAPDAGAGRGADSEPSPSSRRRRMVALLATLAASVIVVAGGYAIVTSDGGTPPRPDTSFLAGRDQRSLPDDATELWSTRLAGSGNSVASSLLVHRDRLVVAVVDDGSRNRSMITGLDAQTGDLLWRRSFSFAPSEMTPLATLDGTIVVQQSDGLSSNRIIGLAATDGSTSWERRLPERSVTQVLAGTELIANISTYGATTTTFYDPGSGEAVGEVPAAMATTDLDGSWYHLSGAALYRSELADGWSPPELVGELETAFGNRVVAVDDRVLTVDASGALAEVVADGPPRELGRATLPPIRSLWPAGGRSFVAVGDGEVFGVVLDGDAPRVTWTRPGFMRTFAMTDRGLALAVTEDDESGRPVVIDAVTGDELVVPEVLGNGGAPPEILGNGFLGTTADGEERVARDLDGGEAWRLDAAGRVAVGSHIVVALDNSAGGYRVTAYGTGS